jgi:transcriptional regulator with XRE-family HTH domain
VAPKDLPRIISVEVIRLLRKERIRRQISMLRLAQKSGLSVAMISYLERDMRNPTLDTLLRITIALDVDLWKLIKRASLRRPDK